MFCPAYWLAKASSPNSFLVFSKPTSLTLLLNAACAVSPSFDFNLVSTCWSIKVLAKSSRDIPTALAKASCWITFILLKSAAVPIFLDISLDKVAISPFKAALLASSKFKSFPVNNSASNSDSIEDWNCNNWPAALFTCSIDKPKERAVTAASANASGVFPKVKAVAFDIFAMSSKTNLVLTAEPVWALNASTCPKYSAVVSSTVLLFNIAFWVKAIAASLLTPACFVNFVKVTNDSLLKEAKVPKALFKTIKDSVSLPVVTLMSILSLAIEFISLLIFKADW